MIAEGAALVTGAARGIGAACAVRLAQDFPVVVLADRDDAGLDDTATAVSAAGARPVRLPVDVSREEDVEEAVRAAVKAGPGLAVGVNCAGIGGPRLTVADYPLEAWQSVLAVDLTGVFLCLRAQLRAMLPAGRGSIVNITSVMGQAAAEFAPAYTAAKHAVEGLTKSAARAHAASGIRVNSVAPGFIDTDLLRARTTPEQREALEKQHPVHRLGTAQEVAEVVAFLASDRAGFVTGSRYRVDGGYLTQG
jgi:NAD(P)-dependent dehydrogenase (short-subunit alcohol dehydrogenase family)